jgi:hypothetical protein
MAIVPFENKFSIGSVLFIDVLGGTMSSWNQLWFQAMV